MAQHLGLLLGVLLVATDKTQPISPSDPHDGAAMASAMIFSLSIMVSLVLGVLIGLITSAFLLKKRKP